MIRSLHNMMKYSSFKQNQINKMFLLKFSSSTTATNKTNKNEDHNNNDDRLNEPILFFGSKAATWKAQKSRSGGADEMLWYQPYVISGSLAIFLIYFCILREENDIDKKLDGKLFDHVDGLEKIQLSLNYKYNKEHGLDVTDIEKRLGELGVDINQL